MGSLFRGMKDDGEGEPACGPTARTLGVRLLGDITIQDDGTVEPGTGGMSVAFNTPKNIRKHRRSREYGGFGPDPVWRIEEDDLPSGLTCRADPNDLSRHGLIEPIESMELAHFQELLASTRGFWSRA